MPFRDVLHRRLQEAEVPLDLVCDLAAREGRRPGSGELDAERHPVHQAAHTLHVRAVAVGERVSAVDLTRAIDEQAHRGTVARVPVPTPVREPIHVEHPLALHLEALP